MSQTELTVLILGALGFTGLIVNAYFGKRLGDTAALVDPLARALITRADVALAPYGPALAPVHQGIELAQSLVDDDTDMLVRALQLPSVIAAIRVGLKELDALTDGIAAVEEKALPDAPQEATGA